MVVHLVVEAQVRDGKIMIYRVGQKLTLKSNYKVKYVIREIRNYEFVANGFFQPVSSNKQKFL